MILDFLSYSRLNMKSVGITDSRVARAALASGPKGPSEAKISEASPPPTSSQLRLTRQDRFPLQQPRDSRVVHVGSRGRRSSSVKCVMGHPPSTQRPSHAHTPVLLPEATWRVGGATGGDPEVRAVSGRDGGEMPTWVRAVTYTWGVEGRSGMHWGEGHYGNVILVLMSLLLSSHFTSLQGENG